MTVRAYGETWPVMATAMVFARFRMAGRGAWGWGQIPRKLRLAGRRAKSNIFVGQTQIACFSAYPNLPVRERHACGALGSRMSDRSAP